MEIRKIISAIVLYFLVFPVQSISCEEEFHDESRHMIINSNGSQEFIAYFMMSIEKDYPNSYKRVFECLRNKFGGNTDSKISVVDKILKANNLKMNSPNRTMFFFVLGDVLDKILQGEDLGTDKEVARSLAEEVIKSFGELANNLKKEKLESKGDSEKGRIFKKRYLLLLLFLIGLGLGIKYYFDKQSGKHKKSEMADAEVFADAEAEFALEPEVDPVEAERERRKKLGYWGRCKENAMKDVRKAGRVLGYVGEAAKVIGVVSQTARAVGAVYDVYQYFTGGSSTEQSQGSTNYYTQQTQNNNYYGMPAQQGAPY